MNIPIIDTQYRASLCLRNKFSLYQAQKTQPQKNPSKTKQISQRIWIRYPKKSRQEFAWIFEACGGNEKNSE